MIASIMLYLLAVSVVASLAAWAADAALRRLRLPSRLAWLAAMGAPPSLLAGPLVSLGGGGGAGAPGGIGPVLELPALVITPTVAAGPALAVACAAMWVVSSLTLAAFLLRAHVGLVRERARWKRLVLHGRDVYVSSERGPAIAGLVRPWIVLPRWSLALDEDELRLVLLHEEEHIRARDTRFLAAALALVVGTPWNPITWWQLRRLKGAMEVDCDRRVLSHEPDRGRYGRSLLSVAARASGPSLGLAAFAERPRSLERRILAMTAKRTPWTIPSAAALIVLSLGLAVQACGVESPVETDAAKVIDRAEITSQTTTVAEPGEPRFTPFTVAPSILNRDEIVAALNSEYPGLLRDAGVGGTVRVYLFVDQTGDVRDVRIHESSGHEALDRAALKVAGIYRFSPALNRDQKVPVWVSFPITFQDRK